MEKTAKTNINMKCRKCGKLISGDVYEFGGVTLCEDDPSTAPHGREQHAVVNAEECTECEICVDICEQGAISMAEA